MYIYKSRILDMLLSSIYSVREVYKKQRVKGCPYDGITFCSTAMPKRSFLALVSRFKRLNKNPSSYYQHVLLSNLFHVYWTPVTSNNKWTTMVRINPNKQELTPQGVLDLLAYVFDDLSQVYVASFDEKIDLKNITVDEVMKGLKIPYSRSIQDYEEETYYSGRRAGQQTKVYDKAKEAGIKNRVLTRIEKTKKFMSNRPTVREFFSYSSSQAIAKLKLIDVDKIDKRTAIGKYISKYDTLKEAELQMPSDLRAKFRKQSKQYPVLIDLESEFAAQLKKWKKSSFKNQRELKRKMALL